MLYSKFIRIVEEHAEKITGEWMKEVKSNPSTTGYRNIPDNILSTRIYDVYKKFGLWILQDEPSDIRTGEHYFMLGRERAAEKIHLSEVVYAMLLSRNVMFKFILNEAIINTPFDTQQAFEFFQKANNFYDKAVYLVCLGYESLAKDDGNEPVKTEFIKKAVDSVTNWLIK